MRNASSIRGKYGGSEWNSESVRDTKAKLKLKMKISEQEIVIAETEGLDMGYVRKLCECEFTKAI